MGSDTSPVNGSAVLCRSWRWRTRCPWLEPTSSWPLTSCQLSQAFLSRQHAAPLDGSAKLVPSSVWQALLYRLPDQKPQTHACTSAYSRLRRSLLAAMSCAHLPLGKTRPAETRPTGQKQNTPIASNGPLDSFQGRCGSLATWLSGCTAASITPLGGRLLHSECRQCSLGSFPYSRGGADLDCSCSVCHVHKAAPMHNEGARLRAQLKQTRFLDAKMSCVYRGVLPTK